MRRRVLLAAGREPCAWEVSKAADAPSENGFCDWKGRLLGAGESSLSSDHLHTNDTHGENLVRISVHSASPKATECLATPYTAPR